MFSIEVNPTVWIALGLGVLWFLNRQSGGAILNTLKGVVSNPQPPVAMPGVQPAVSANLPNVQTRVDAANLLKSLFVTVGCKEGAAAMDTVFDHLLDDHKTHETK